MTALSSTRRLGGIVRLLTKANRFAVGLGMVWTTDGVPVSMRLKFVDGTSRSFDIAAIRGIFYSKGKPARMQVVLRAGTSRSFDIASIRSVTFHGADTLGKRLQVDGVRSRLVRVAERQLGMCAAVFRSSRPDVARVAAHTLEGQQIRLLAEERFEAGDHVIFWNGTDAENARAAPGTYAIRVSRSGSEVARTLVKVR